MMLKNIFRNMPAALLLLMLTGCGYHIGFIKHPQLNSIAVAPVENSTSVYNAASNMRMMASEVIMQDGTYKLLDQKRADAVLFMTIKNIAFTAVGTSAVERDRDYRPDEWIARVTVEYKLIIPGQGEPLMAGTVSGQSHFQAGADVESGRLSGVQQACYDTALHLVRQISEGW